MPHCEPVSHGYGVLSSSPSGRSLTPGWLRIWTEYVASPPQLATNTFCAASPIEFSLSSVDHTPSLQL